MVVFWFRRDLRWEDNKGLYEAVQSGEEILPLFIFDHQILNSFPGKSDPRVDFIYNNLQKLWADSDHRLLVRYGSPFEVFKEILNTYEISGVYTNRDYEPASIQRDEQIAEVLAGEGISFYDYKDQVVFEKDEVLKKDGGPYTVYTPYKNKWLEQFSPQEDLREYQSIEALNKLVNQKFEFPALKSIGYEKSTIEVPDFTISKKRVQGYSDNRNIPSVEGTTDLGIFLRFGTISIREVIRRTKNNSQTLLQEFIWREFFMQILYHFPKVVNDSFKSKYDKIEWRNDESDFKNWCKGETGYPIVDAGMRQLNQTGRMHNRVRMITASFLVKHLLIDWRWGEAYFREKLLDYELASNNGNWQWAAGCGCDAAPYFRIFNPYEQHKKFDGQSKYIQKWVPEFQLPGYTEEIVGHKFARERALSHYKKCLNQ